MGCVKASFESGTQLPPASDEGDAAQVTVEDIEDNPGFFRIKLFVIPHFQAEGMDIGLSLVSQIPKRRTDSL